MHAQSPCTISARTGTWVTESLPSDSSISPSFAIAYGTRAPESIDVCNVPSDDNIRPTVKIATETPTAKVAASPPKNRPTTCFATEELDGTDAIAVGSST